jgi:hypothetical protein
MKLQIFFTKKYLLLRLLFVQSAGYAILLFLIAGDELFDFPHTVFGQMETPVNWAEIYIESGYILVLAIFSLTFTWYLIRRLKFFDGLIPICSFCKKIRENNDWISLEEYVGNHSEAMLSHGLCPECKELHYPKHIKK